MVTSVSWIKRGSHLAIGTRSGLIQIWDVNRGRRVRCMTGHTKRVGALSWNDHILTSGSRDRSIIHRDVRIADHYTCKLEGAHKQEVCGLQWNYEASGGRGLLASGGNDNKLAIWDSAMTGSAGVSANGVHSANTTSSYSSSPGTDSGSNWKPLYRFTDHKAAVKALAWSPHTRNLLASGGERLIAELGFGIRLKATAFRNWIQAVKYVVWNGASSGQSLCQVMAIPRMPLSFGSTLA